MGSKQTKPKQEGETQRPELSIEKRSILENNRVIVCVWTSKCLGGRRDSGHVSVIITRGNEQGTLPKGTYISFWPKLVLDEKKWPSKKSRPEFITNGESWSFIQDYTGDRLLERRRPEYIFCFYGLQTEEIMNAFKLFKENPGKWARRGNYTPKMLPGNLNYEDEIEMKKKQSCVSLACLTLDAGGINQLIGPKDAVKGSSKALTGVSAENSSEMVQNFNFIHPSTNISEYVKRELVSFFIISPDVLVARLKIAKKKEWDSREDVRLLGRMVCVTDINENGSERNVTFSHQNVTDPVDDNETMPIEGNVQHEKTFEWLPVDENESCNSES